MKSIGFEVDDINERFSSTQIILELVCDVLYTFNIKNDIEMSLKFHQFWTLEKLISDWVKLSCVHNDIFTLSKVRALVHTDKHGNLINDKPIEYELVIHNLELFDLNQIKNVPVTRITSALFESTTNHYMVNGTFIENTFYKTLIAANAAIPLEKRCCITHAEMEKLRRTP